MKSSALEVLENQGKPGESGLAWWQGTTQNVSSLVIQEGVQETWGTQGPPPTAGIPGHLRPLKVIQGWHLGEGWEIGLLQAPTPSEGLGAFAPTGGPRGKAKGRLCN